MSVAVFHFTTLVGQRSDLRGWERMFAELIGDHRLDIGKAAVFLFFLISGYVIPVSVRPGREGMEDFARGRIFRLYPLYWLSLAAALLMISLEGGPPPDAATILANLTMLQGFLGRPDVLHVYWTLQIEMTFYFCCAALAALRLLGSPRVLAAAALLFAVGALFGAIAAALLDRRLPLTMPLALSLMFFGALWRYAILEQSRPARTLASRVLPMLLVTIIICCTNYREDTLSYIGCYAMALAAFVLGTSVMRSAAGGIVRIGRVSYSIYLMHPIVASAYLRVLHLDAYVTPHDPLADVLLLSAATYITACVTFHMIELPSIRFGRSFTPSVVQRRAG